MKRLTFTLAVALCAGMIASAASAAVWTCKASNARGAIYVANGVVKANVRARALARCRADSVAPRTCYIVSCTLP